MNELGVDNFYIELVEECPCDNLDQLRKKEGEYIRSMGTLNSLISGRGDKEYRSDNYERISENKKEYWNNNKDKLTEYKKNYDQEHKEEMAEKAKEYREKNREEVLRKKREYHHRNKEAISEKNKDYYQQNKATIIQKVSEYREQNKDKIVERKSAKFICECGGECRKDDKARHFRTKKHNDYLLAHAGFV
jgi:glucosamine 6-phosphate synthetase-like amidotransferase/phosphosugar isomerase protein